MLDRCCRVCLTTEEDERFQQIRDDLANKIFVLFKIRLSIKNLNIICCQCEKDIETSWKVNLRIQDADEYFELQAVQKKQQILQKENSAELKSPARPKEKSVVFECDSCKTSFDNMNLLNDHMQRHNGEFNFRI